MARKYRIPYTRSGSSMIASILTQALQQHHAEARKIRDAEYAKKCRFIDAKVRSGELTPGQAYFEKNTLGCIFLGFVLVWAVVVFAMILFSK